MWAKSTREISSLEWEEPVDGNVVKTAGKHSDGFIYTEMFGAYQSISFCLSIIFSRIAAGSKRTVR